ncbi:MAG: DUF1614 domain-containing protein [Clostridiales bacterium]|nr:DUF1614 domain-containing protein [Clostridiales bacterium]
MTFGMTMLVVMTILVLFGVGQRILDRMRLSDKGAVMFMLAIFIGGLLPDIPLGDRISINIGGAIIPFILVVYLYIKAGTAKEKIRSIVASILAGAAVFLAGRFLPAEPEAMMVDPNYVYGIVAGIIAYMMGRSRRASFIAGVMGVILADIAQGVENVIMGIPSPIRLGAGGVVDAIVLSGILAVILAEVVGEFREKLQGGTKKGHLIFEHGEFSEELEPDIKSKQSEEARSDEED